MSNSVFNANNSAWVNGNYPLFLGEKLALHDSVNTPYPKLFDLYKLLKSMDWSEDEVNLEQSRLDLLSCPKNNYDIMIKTLAFQWELDSVASRSIAPLFAPFVTNSELWGMLSKQSENEVLHGLTYSEIIRQCVTDPQDVFKEVMKNDEVINRSKSVVAAFDKLALVGGLYQAGGINLVKRMSTTSYVDINGEPTDDVHILYIRKTILKAYIALYALERIEFLSSFACTFALAEQGSFQGIAKLVQKIAQDEQVHVMMDEEVIRILKDDPEWAGILSSDSFKRELADLVDSVVEQERSWNNYLFSEGRSIVGLNENLLNEWVYYNAASVYKTLDMVNVYPHVSKNPLPWMNNWLDLNKTQNANQEADNTNYRLNSIIDDSSEEVFEI